MSNLWDYTDLFRTSYTFSNRISSVFGKVFTISYVCIFMYLSISACISIFGNKTIIVTNIQTYDKDFNTNQEYYFKNLHVVLYLQLFTSNGEAVQKNETTSIFNDYLNSQVSTIESNKYNYQKKDLMDYKCGEKGNILLFCINYEINTLNDFLLITLTKNVLITQGQLDTFFNNYMLKFHVDYYYLQPCTVKYYVNIKELETSLALNNPIFVQNKVFDYVKNSYGSYDIRLGNNDKDTFGNNIILNFKAMKLQLDSGALFSDESYFNSFMFSKETKSYTTNLFSMTFRLSPVIETFQFKYKKIQQSFAEISGIMEFVKFCCIAVILIINFIKQHTFFSSKMFKRKVIFISDQDNIMNKAIISNNTMISSVSSPFFKNRENPRIDINPRPYLSPIIHANVHKQIDENKNECYIIEDDLKLKKLTTDTSSNLKINNISIRRRSEVKSSGQRNVVSNNNNNNLHIDKEVVSAYIKEFRINKNRNYSHFAIFKLFLCGRCRKSRYIQYQIFTSMIKNNLKKMDFVRIIKKVNKIDVFSYLLFDETQRSMMKYIDKEQIYYDKARNTSHFVTKYNNKIPQEKETDLMKDFIIKMKSKNHTELDKRLYSLLNEELLAL